jgi:hypothetical protein
MKIIKYKFLSAEVNRGSETQPILEQIFFDKSISYSEANEEIAKREACNGEYTIEDDGQPEPVAEPTTDEILNAMLGVTE